MAPAITLVDIERLRLEIELVKEDVMSIGSGGKESEGSGEKRKRSKKSKDKEKKRRKRGNQAKDHLHYLRRRRTWRDKACDTKLFELPTSSKFAQS
mgnify:CR=1 FL=1